MWRDRQVELAAYVRAHGGAMPRQKDSAEALSLYRWLKFQRVQDDARTLPADRVQALDHTGEWRGAVRGNSDDYWARRLAELKQFRLQKGRWPHTDRQRYPDEQVLATWLIRQRTWHRKGLLRVDRRERLNQELPTWLG